MGSAPGTNSCPFADVVTVVPSQAAACDTKPSLKYKHNKILSSWPYKILYNLELDQNYPKKNRQQKQLLKKGKTSSNSWNNETLTSIF